MSMTTTRGITMAGWLLLGSVALTVVASLLPWYSVTILGLTASANAWNSWWWLSVVLAIVAAVIYLVGALSGSANTRLALPIAGVASFLLTLIVLIYILATGTDALRVGDSDSLVGNTVASAGPSFGIFLALLTTAATAYFSAVCAQDAGTKLPFRVRGPR